MTDAEMPTNMNLVYAPPAPQQSTYDGLVKLGLPSAYDKGLDKSKIDLACWEDRLMLTDAQILAMRDADYVAGERQTAQNNINATINYYETEAKIFAHIREYGNEDG
jgi:hypothetical protein